MFIAAALPRLHVWDNMFVGHLAVALAAKKVEPQVQFLGSGFAPLDTDHIGRVGCPTLLMTGQRSPRLFSRLTDRLEELLPRVERFEVPEASHIMHEDNPSGFGVRVLSFLADKRSAANKR